jgi:hypothetical protein
MSDKAYTVIGTNVVIDCGTVEEAIAYERELWANQPYAPATPAPLDVERLARAMERMSGVADPIDPGDCMAGVVTHREFAAAIAAAYAEEKE